MHLGEHDEARLLRPQDAQGGVAAVGVGLRGCRVLRLQGRREGQRQHGHAGEGGQEERGRGGRRERLRQPTQEGSSSTGASMPVGGGLRIPTTVGLAEHEVGLPEGGWPHLVEEGVEAAGQAGVAAAQAQLAAHVQDGLPQGLPRRHPAHGRPGRQRAQGILHAGRPLPAPGRAGPAGKEVQGQQALESLLRQGGKGKGGKACTRKRRRFAG